jgi:hypothetical protein
MPQYLLHAAQVAATLKKVRGRRVTQGVRSDVWHASLTGELVDDASDLPLVDPAASSAEEERVSGFSSHGQRGSAPLDPLAQGLVRGHSEGDDAFLSALSEDADGSGSLVDG